MLRSFVAFSSKMATEYRTRFYAKKTSPTNNDRLANLAIDLNISGSVSGNESEGH